MHAIALTAAALLAGSGGSSAFGGTSTYGKHASFKGRRNRSRVAAARKSGAAMAIAGLGAPTFDAARETENVAEFNARLQAWRAVREIPAR